MISMECFSDSVECTDHDPLYWSQDLEDHTAYQEVQTDRIRHSGQIGDPRPFDATEEIDELLQKLSTFRKTEAVVGHANSINALLPVLD